MSHSQLPLKSWHLFRRREEGELLEEELQHWGPWAQFFFVLWENCERQWSFLGHSRGFQDSGSSGHWGLLVMSYWPDSFITPPPSGRILSNVKKNAWGPLKVGESVESLQLHLWKPRPGSLHGFTKAYLGSEIQEIELALAKQWYFGTFYSSTRYIGPQS